MKKKERIRSKPLELYKTRTRKSRPDLLNFNVVLTGHDMITDTGRATTWRLKIKEPSLPTKSTKNAGPFENIGFTGKTV